MFKLFYFLRPYRLLIAFVVILTIVGIISALMLPTLMAFIVNDGINYGGGEGNWDVVLFFSALMAGVGLLQFIVGVAQGKILAKVSSHFAYDVRQALFTKIEHLSFKQFNHFGNASLQARSTSDVSQLQEILQWLINLFSIPLYLVGGVVFALMISPTLSLVIALSIPFVIFVVWGVARYIRPLVKVSQMHLDKFLLILRERLVGIRVIRAFNKEDYEHSRLHTQANIMSTNFIRRNIAITATLWPLLTLIGNFTIVGIIFASYRMSGNQTVFQAGDIIAVVQYVGVIMTAISMVSWSIVQIPGFNVSAGRIREVLDLPLEEQIRDMNFDKADRAGNVNKEKAKISGHIKINDLTFFYDEKSKEPVLQNINMEFLPSKTYAILGGTGSGKTSLIKLLLRFYEITSGSILIDGKEISELDEYELRDNIGYITQKSIIFKGTIKSNVLLGRAYATDAEILEVLRIVQLEDFVKSLPSGVESEINESGTNLSGGQKQRLSIARALVKNAPINLFDDSFSALDYATDVKIRKEIALNYKGATNIIVTQRVSTSLGADYTYVLDEGKLAGEGTHKELLKTCEIYKRLAKLQLDIG
ncbi:MAG: ABC transporter ATP-binding protein/permease [Firmicutes bacterium]|nr:ABC transporter ATP-binding protein/permease [Bacillota bacterium]